jgi:hypothetical protein
MIARKRHAPREEFMNDRAARTTICQGITGRIARPLLLLSLTFALTGCMATYRDFPVAALDRNPDPGACSVMYYNVKRFDILDMGGYSMLNETFRNAGMCKKMVPAETCPDKGLYVEVETKWKPITLPALVFGYLSISTLTILPVWSTRDGYLVRYDVFVDGKKKDSYYYEITRKAGIWIGLIPFSWINFMTYSEEDAFRATAYQFIHDAGPYLTNKDM